MAEYTYDEVRGAADRFAERMPDLLPNTWPKSTEQVLVDIEQFLAGLVVDLGVEGYLNTELGDGVSTMFLLAEVRTAARACGRSTSASEASDA